MKLTANKLQKKIVVATVIFLTLVMTLFMSRILIFNLTDSLPLGLWKRTSLSLERGGVVGFCPTLSDQLKSDYRLQASKNGFDMRLYFLCARGYGHGLHKINHPC